MAEVIARDVFEKKNVEAGIISRGISVFSDTEASVNSKKAVEELGLSLDGFRSHQLTYEDIDWADIVITMTGSHKNVVAGACIEKGKELYTIAEAAREENDVSDPFGGDIDVYRACAKQIKAYIEKIADRLM